MLFFLYFFVPDLTLSRGSLQLLLINHIIKKKERCQSKAKQSKQTMGSNNNRKARCGNRYAWSSSFLHLLFFLSLSFFISLLQQVKKLYSPPTNSISFFFRHVSSLIINDNRQPERIFTSSCGCPSPWGLFYLTSGF